MNEERLVNIEIKIAYQEDLIDSLNKTIYQQQKQIDQLAATCAALKGSLTSLAQSVNENNAVVDERPPHY